MSTEIDELKQARYRSDKTISGHNAFLRPPTGETNSVDTRGFYFVLKEPHPFFFRTGSSIQRVGSTFVHHHRIGFQRLKVIRAIMRCRTAALGGHRDKCMRCGFGVISFNSCRNRHCPKCQAQARKRWIAARERELLKTAYFHVVFSLPHQLNALIRQNEVELYNLLFRAVAQTLVEVARNPKHLGAEIG